MKKLLLSAMFVAVTIIIISCGNKKEKIETIEETIDWAYNDDNSSETVEYSSSSSSSSTDWDAILDDYEKYVDESIELYNKAKQNKTKSTIQQLERLEDQLGDLSEKIEKASSNISTSQLQRFNKITSKYANVMYKISDIIDDFDDDDYGFSSFGNDDDDDDDDW